MARATAKPAPKTGLEHSEQITIRLPPPHEHQAIFTDWNELYPNAQVLVAPCGVKVGKSFGSAIWLLTQALVNERFFCVWIAPTKYKARVGYRYMKAMLPEIPGVVQCLDGKLEIRLANGSVIHFLHGRDAEVTIEGEAVDAFVIDEGGKQDRQLWLSLFTTITQTGGRGIITGTPRGFTWYSEVFKLAKAGDPFFCWTQLATSCSPFVKPEAIANAKRLLPPPLFKQYYLAQFISFSSVFGELDLMWQDEFKVDRPSIWLHPSAAALAEDVAIGADWAKVNDYTVFTAVNAKGQLVGFYRFRGGPYPQQVRKLKAFAKRFTGNVAIVFDATGVGSAVEDLIVDADMDADIIPMTFTQKSKHEMVTRFAVAVAEGWLKSPRIERLEAELTMLEVLLGKNSRPTYGAPKGEHDDCAWSVMLAVHEAYAGFQTEELEQSMADAQAGTLGKNDRDEDDLTEGYASAAAGDDDEDDDLLDLEPDDEFDEAELDD